LHVRQTTEMFGDRTKEQMPESFTKYSSYLLLYNSGNLKFVIKHAEYTAVNCDFECTWVKKAVSSSLNAHCLFYTAVKYTQVIMKLSFN
jgi:hypothetical protein